MIRKPCKIRCPLRGGTNKWTVAQLPVFYGARGVFTVSWVVFTKIATVFAEFYGEPCSENRVKYGVRCAGAVAGLTFAFVFSVFAALYVEACSENRVKYGAQCET